MPHQRITDHGPSRKYFTQVPNLLDDSDLDPPARALYLHYVRLAGRHESCEETVRDSAACCRMSLGAVVRARRTLAESGWIEIEERGTHGRGADQVIHLLDRWVENMMVYGATPSSEAGIVHILNNSVDAEPPADQPSKDPNCSTGDMDCSPVERIVPPEKQFKLEPLINPEYREDREDILSPLSPSRFAKGGRKKSAPRSRDRPVPERNGHSPPRRPQNVLVWNSPEDLALLNGDR